MRVVLDTNVLVSALLRSDSKPAAILNLITNQELNLLVDDRILGEYREVLRRPKFGFDENAVDDVVAFLDGIAEWVIASPLNMSIPDPGDLMFLEVALSGAADVLITGNKPDYGRPPKELKIQSPNEFLKDFA